MMQRLSTASLKQTAQTSLISALSIHQAILISPIMVRTALPQSFMQPEAHSRAAAMQSQPLQQMMTAHQQTMALTGSSALTVHLAIKLRFQPQLYI
jgi:hypothetical protein